MRNFHIWSLLPDGTQIEAIFSNRQELDTELRLFFSKTLNCIPSSRGQVNKLISSLDTMNAPFVNITNSIDSFFKIKRTDQHIVGKEKLDFSINNPP